MVLLPDWPQAAAASHAAAQAACDDSGADCQRCHWPLVGRPARSAALERFLDHVQRHDRVWLARRIDIAEHWRAVHPAG